MELKVGMYVRFEGMINKIIEMEDDYITFDVSWYDHWEDLISYMKIDRFVKDYKPIASYDIYDLIEVGDYVNGKQVIYKWEEPSGTFAGQTFIQLDGEDTVPTMREIKSILTKEQIQNTTYYI